MHRRRRSEHEDVAAALNNLAEIRVEYFGSAATVFEAFRAAAPYAVAWDEGRKVLWVVTANADAIYRLDPESGAFTVLPLPRRMAFLRQLGVEDARHERHAAAAAGPRLGAALQLTERADTASNRRTKR